MKALLHSRAFWTVLVDAAIGTIGLVIDLAKPEFKMLFVTIWGIWQPLVILLIANFATEALYTKMTAFYLRMPK